MKMMSFIKKIIIGSLLVQNQTQAAVLNDGVASCEGEVFNPCEPFGFHVAVGRPTRGTTRWMLGELHTYSAQTQKCIAALAMLPDETTIYIEGLDANQGEAQCSQYVDMVMGSRVKCRGWDDASALYDIYENDFDLIYASHKSDLKTNYEQLKISDNEFKDHLNYVLTADHDLTELEGGVGKDNIEKALKLLRLSIKKLLQVYEKEKSFKRIFEKEEVVNKPIDFDSIYKRDVSLMAALRRDYSGKRQVVVAGRGHFLPDMMRNKNPNPDQHDYVRRELEKDKDSDGASYVILGFRP